MAITNFSTLQTEIADWLDRSDLAAKIPMFIQLAEVNFKTDLRLRMMEKTATIDLLTGVTDYNIKTFLPGFLQLRAMIIQTDQKVIMEYLTPEVMNEVWGNDPNGQPRAYSLLGENLRVAPAPDSRYAAADMKVTYFKAMDGLSVSQPANQLLEEYPNIYLFGALLQAEPFLQDDSRLEVWTNFYTNAVRRAMNSDGRGTLQGNPLERSESA